MKEKIRKLIDENFSHAEVFDDNEEGFTVGGKKMIIYPEPMNKVVHALLPDSLHDILNEKIEELPTNTGSGLFAFKSKVFPGDALSDTAKRTVIESDGKDFFDSPSEHESDDEKYVYL